MEYRTHNGMVDYEYLLVMTQPTKNACVRVIDRDLPWFSFNDDDIALILGQNSDPRHIDTEGVSPKLRESIFGPEPAHGWCYFYEKADLALQSKDYRQVIALGTEAAKQGLQPADPVEWMPFLQAYAVLGDAAELERIGEKMIETEFNRVQACGVLSKMQENGVVFTPQIQEYTARMICRVEKK